MLAVDETNPFLTGNYAPINDELIVNHLEVIGEIPQSMCGIYMRNGPNPEFMPIAYHFPFDGDGMIHAVYIDKGKANYRNRFVETEELLAERRAGKALYGSVLQPILPDPNTILPNGNFGPFKNGNFIHIIHHANRYLAMHESAPAYEITSLLETKQKWRPIGCEKPINVGPHTRYDARTGELWLINYDIDLPFLTVSQIDKQGILQKQIPIDKPYSTMIHDFVLTENYVVIFDCPVILDVNQLEMGGNIINWKPELGVRIGLLPRKGGNITWCETESFFVFHFANAYEVNNEIIVDLVRYPHFNLEEKDEFMSNHHLFRTTIDLLTARIKHEQLDDRIMEFPRIREDRNSYLYRYIYLPAMTNKENTGFNAIVKYDTHTQSTIAHDFGQLAEVGEAVFVPKENAIDEDEGYVVFYAYYKVSNSSELVILDAQNLNKTPLARIKMPRRIPHGLHGSWMNGAW